MKTTINQSVSISVKVIPAFIRKAENLNKHILIDLNKGISL